MKIEDRRNDNKRKCAGIGDMIVTNKNNRYLLLGNSQVEEEYPIAVYNLDNNCIDFTTCQSVFCVGGDLLWETIMEIIPKEKLKLVIG